MIGTVRTVLKAPPEVGWNWICTCWAWPVDSWALWAGRTQPQTTSGWPFAAVWTGRKIGIRNAA